VVEPRPDQEHVERQADGAQHVQDRPDVLREQGRLRVGEEPAEERRSEEHAGDHLAEHARLHHHLRQPAADRRDDQDHDEGGQDLEYESEVRIGRRDVGQCGHVRFSAG
jgi:hypothetical protein